MDNEVGSSSNIKTWIIVGVVAFITFIIVFSLCYKFINGNKKTISSESDTEVIVSYNAYKIGDAVTLKDGSKWHVLYNSIKNTENVTLLSDLDINTSNVTYGNLNSYLDATYKNMLMSSLKASKSDIVELRLFAYLDLAHLAGIDSKEFSPEPETELSKYSIPKFVYSSETVTDTVYNSGSTTNPVMICVADEVKEARLCLGESKEVLPVRPVLVISKKYISDEETTNTNSSSKQTLIEEDGK